MSVDVDRVVAGAPVMWPATVTGGRVLHLARSQARRKAEPVLVGVCPGLRDVQLVAAPRLRWWQRLTTRRRWCPDCSRYRDYLRSLGAV